MNKVFSHVGDTIHATIYGTLAVAAVQGTLGGLMFWWLGLPAPVLWGLVMGVLLGGAPSQGDGRGKYCRCTAQDCCRASERAQCANRQQHPQLPRFNDRLMKGSDQEFDLFVN